ncbi:hypothetical protein [Bacillus haynesii]|nr:hypothetical protein [Bacillus haynesii]MCY7860550.1 hypothetical protein [Bacillus haynesii]MCY8342687.1 hypothetical protein [Bacillus haynesii]MCY9153247.1 hypothetical protein [Bacillus haynesii]MCY9263905.1 hypothetical protein [Bacillus haynesii]MCY9371051.1 hypothetical protein [Bacillus haynesii]
MTTVGISDKAEAPITVDNKNFSFVFFSSASFFSPVHKNKKDNKKQKIN